MYEKQKNIKIINEFHLSHRREWTIIFAERPFLGLYSSLKPWYVHADYHFFRDFHCVLYVFKSRLIKAKPSSLIH